MATLLLDYTICLTDQNNGGSIQASIYLVDPNYALELGKCSSEPGNSSSGSNTSSAYTAL